MNIKVTLMFKYDQKKNIESNINFEMRHRPTHNSFILASRLEERSELVSNKLTLYI